MKHTTKVTVTREETDWVECDLCGGKVERVETLNYDDYDDMGDIRYDQVNRMQRCVGKQSRWPDGGGGGVKQTVDMCGDCWESKFILWLESMGVEIREEKYEY